MRPFLFLLALILPSGLFAQSFQPDVLGHVHGQAFRDFIAKEGFELVGAFARETYKSDTIWIAKVMKGGEWLYIDTQGNRFADEQAVKDYLEQVNSGKTTERFQRREGSPFDRDGDLAFTIEEPVVLMGNDGDEGPTGEVFAKGKHFGYRNSDGTELIAPVYDAIEALGNDKRPFLKLTRKGKQGLADCTGKIIVPVSYREVYVLFEKAGYQLGPKGLVTLSDEGYTLLRLDGTNWLAPQSYRPSPQDGYFLLTDPVTKKKGAMTESGKLIVPVEFDAVIRQKGTDLLFVSTGREYSDDYKLGAYDLEGKRVLDVQYQQCQEFSDYLLAIRSGSGYDQICYGLFDTWSKTFILPVEYRFSDWPMSKIVVRKGPRDAEIYGMINDRGEWLLPLQYSFLDYVRNRPYLVAAMNGAYGVIDFSGHPIIPFSYDYLRMLNDCTRCGNLPKDQFIVGLNGQYGIIDGNNQVVLPLKFPQFASTNTALGIEGHDRSVFMDLDGNILYTAEFRVTRFYGGLIEGRTNDNRPVQADLYGHTVIR